MLLTAIHAVGKWIAVRAATNAERYADTSGLGYCEHNSHRNWPRSSSLKSFPQSPHVPYRHFLHVGQYPAPRPAQPWHPSTSGSSVTKSADIRRRAFAIASRYFCFHSSFIHPATTSVSTEVSLVSPQLALYVLSGISFLL